MPAYDVLELDRNDGTDYKHDLSLCFAALGDLRKVVSSMAGFPLDFSESCTCIVNDVDLDVVIRNVVMVILSLPSPRTE